jgi:hypothetical protein
METEDRVYRAFADEIFKIRKEIEKATDKNDARRLFRRIRELKSLQFWHLGPSQREDLLKL